MEPATEPEVTGDAVRQALGAVLDHADPAAVEDLAAAAERHLHPPADRTAQTIWSHALAAWERATAPANSSAESAGNLRVEARGVGPHGG